MKINKKIWFLRKAFHFCFLNIMVYVFLLLCPSLANLLINLVNKNIVNELIKNTTYGFISKKFLWLILLYLMLYLTQRISGFIIAMGKNFYRFDVDQLFHTIFMWKSYCTNQEYFFERDFMEKYSYISGKNDKVSSYISNILTFIIRDVGTLIGTLVLFAVYEPLLVIYTLIISIGLILINKWMVEKEYALDKKQIKEQRYHDYYKEILSGKSNAKELRVYNLKMFIFRKWLLIYEKLRIERLELALQKVKLNNFFDIIKFVFKIFAIAVLLFGVYYKRYDVGTVVMLIGLINNSTQQIENINDSLMSGAHKDAKFLEEYYDYVTPITNQQIKMLRQIHIEENKLSFGPFSELCLENVSYTYPNSHVQAISQVSLSIKKGEIISILGYNGAGKTTLSKLICGSLTPKEGTIIMNGFTITVKDRMNYFKYFGMAPQEFSRFSLPIKELVGLGRIELYNNQEELEKAYKKSGLNTLIGKYPERDKTVLGKEYDESGIDLSGGEWQKVILASAFMGEPEILLLDEPTAAIDPLKEIEVLHNLKKNLQGKTAILISHRIGFARLADRIVMMENGKIIEQGTHDQLLQQNGYYAKIFFEQKKLYDEGDCSERK